MMADVMRTGLLVLVLGSGMVLVAAVVGATAGLATYRWTRRGLYTRPLTPHERWAETGGANGMSEEDWAEVMAAEHAPVVTPEDRV